jgi:PBP1b-binding outer membrane lipoprotein LpoB
MKSKAYLYTTLSALIFSGCAANTMGVTPSQNNTLQAVSPSGTAASSGGAMQHSLDGWLKEEWTPMTDSAPVVKTTTSPDGTVIQTKTEATKVITTTTAPDGKVVTTTAAVAVLAEPIDETPFTLQKYADKWKVYHENKAKMNEGKPKEASNIEKIQSMPVIGK